jgi:hypothetical protein
MAKLVLERPTAKERQALWAALRGIPGTALKVSALDLLDSLIECLQLHPQQASLLGEPSWLWIDPISWFPTERFDAILPTFAAFGLPHHNERYQTFVDKWALRTGSVGPETPFLLTHRELDVFIMWLHRGHVWSETFLPYRIADGTVLNVALRLRELVTGTDDIIAAATRMALDCRGAASQGGGNGSQVASRH